MVQATLGGAIVLDGMVLHMVRSLEDGVCVFVCACARVSERESVL